MSWSQSDLVRVTDQGESAPPAVPRDRISRLGLTASPGFGYSTTVTRRSCRRMSYAVMRQSSGPSERWSTQGRFRSCLAVDHGIAEPNIRACARRHGALALVHFDTHTDTGREVFGVEVSHGTPMFRLVEQGHVDPVRYIQVGLRGYWPGEAEFSWQAERGITSIFMHEVRDLGIDAVMQRVLHAIGGRRAYLSLDIDVLDPAFAPGTGTPEPGGMDSAELLRAARLLASGLDLVGAEVVEVIPTAVGSADITALAAERLVREIITGIAMRRGTAK